MAAKIFDLSIVDLLLAHGARPELAHLLQATWQDPVLEGELLSHRRPFAEYLVSRKIVDINEVKQMPLLTAVAHMPGTRKDATPF